MARDDVSDKLIHFIKGDSRDAAFNTLRTILNEHRLIGGTGCIKGQFNCVCFSEAPLTALENGLLNGSAYSRYKPFGIMFDKKWIFEQGGRPVIYQPNSEYDVLPPSHKWRHVRYEPNADSVVDFTWEREWRLRVDELSFDPSVAAIVVPDRDWTLALIIKHEVQEDTKVLQYSQIMDEELAMQYRDSFDWLIYILR